MDGLGILGTALGTILARLGRHLLTREVQKFELALSFQKVDFGRLSGTGASDYSSSLGTLGDAVGTGYLFLV